MLKFICLLLSGILLYVLPLRSQNTVTASRDDVKERLPLYRWPYAGKYAPRIGGSGESANDKVRLDIGGSVSLFEEVREVEYEDLCGHDPVCDNDSYDPYLETLWTPLAVNLSIGADFFTWSRLRSESNFKFPVEAVDYYFGFYGSARIGRAGDTYRNPPRTFENPEKHRTTFIPTVRIAHISAHLVDGDPQFALPNDGAVVYSREFIDLSMGMEHLFWTGCCLDGFRGRTGYLRPYIGTQLLFHTIPDDLGRVTPYIGGDLEIDLFERSGSPTLRAGYAATTRCRAGPRRSASTRSGPE